MNSGPGIGTYRPWVELALTYTTPSQSKIGWSVGVGFSTMRGDFNPGDIYPCLFPGCRGCLCMCGLTTILGWNPDVPRRRLLYVRSLADERPAIRQKAIPGSMCFVMFYLKLEAEIQNCQILSSVLSRTHQYYTYQIATSNSNVVEIIFEEMNDEAVTPSFTPTIPSASLSTITLYTHSQSVCEPGI